MEFIPSTSGTAQDLPRSTGSDTAPHPLTAGSSSQFQRSAVTPSSNTSPAESRLSGKRGSTKSSLRDYKQLPRDRLLYDDIDNWRRAKTVEMYGEGMLRDFGPSVVLPNTILDRIVDCAHYGVIKELDDLRREASWGQAKCYGAEVLGLIEQYPTPASLESSSTRSSQQVRRRGPLSESTRAINGATGTQVSDFVGLQCHC